MRGAVSQAWEFQEFRQVTLILVFGLEHCLEGIIIVIESHMWSRRLGVFVWPKGHCEVEVKSFKLQKQESRDTERSVNHFHKPAHPCLIAHFSDSNSPWSRCKKSISDIKEQEKMFYSDFAAADFAKGDPAS